MKMRTLFLINAIVQFIFGLGFLFAPAILLGVFGTKTDTTGIALAHVAGGTIFSLGIISWLGKDLDNGAMNAIAWGGVFCSHLLAGIFVMLATLNGTFNAVGWSAVVMDAFFVGAFFWVRGNKAM